MKTKDSTMKTKGSRCIICGNEREGLEVLPDYMLDTIRWFKRKTGTEKKYRLVVCRDCFESYSKLRQRYRRRQIECVALGLIFAAVLVSFNFVRGIFFGGAIVVFMYLLSQLSWIPALRMPAPEKKAKR
jgi:hypothetical protein